MILYEHSAVAAGPATTIASARKWTYRVRYQCFEPASLTITVDGARPMTLRVHDPEPCWAGVTDLDLLTTRSATTSIADEYRSISLPEPAVPRIDVATPLTATSVDDIVRQLFEGAPPAPVRLGVAYHRDLTILPVLLLRDAIPDVSAIENAIRQWAAAQDVPREGAEFVFDLTWPPSLHFRHISVPFGAIVPEMTAETERL
jgi:hypothetical protein